MNCQCGECVCVPQAPAYFKELLVIEALRKAGHEAWFVGGCVRDKVLDDVPKDYDIVTSAQPVDVQSLFKKVLVEGQRYGVVAVCDYGSKIDVATYRKDVFFSNGAGDGRRPDKVELTNNIKEDSSRRDFTINAMYWNPTTGEIVDHHGGLQDLKSGIIRAVGPAGDRMKEDYLRILRAVRFAAKYGFEIDPDLRAAIIEHRDGLTQISKERIRDEFFQIMRFKGGYKLLSDFGLLRYILGQDHNSWTYHPAIGCMEIADRLANLSKTVITDGLILGCIQYHLTPGEICDIGENLKLPGEEVRRAISIVRGLPLARRFRSMTIVDAIELMRTPESPYVFVAMSVVDANYDLYRTYLKMTTVYRDKISSQPIVKGDTLIRMGFKPGPVFSEIIRDCRRLQDGDIFKCESEFKNFIGVFYGNRVAREVRPLQEVNAAQESNGKD